MCGTSLQGPCIPGTLEEGSQEDFQGLESGLGREGEEGRCHNDPSYRSGETLHSHRLLAVKGRLLCPAHG